MFFLSSKWLPLILYRNTRNFKELSILRSNQESLVMVWADILRLPSICLPLLAFDSSRSTSSCTKNFIYPSALIWTGRKKKFSITKRKNKFSTCLKFMKMKPLQAFDSTWRTFSVIPWASYLTCNVASKITCLGANYFTCIQISVQVI